MAIYRTFYILDEKNSTPQVRHVRAKTFDVGRVESWEYYSNDYTKVTMMSGETFLIKEVMPVFTDLMFALEDGYGMLFEFNNN